MFRAVLAVENWPLFFCCLVLLFQVISLRPSRLLVSVCVSLSWMERLSSSAVQRFSGSWFLALSSLLLLSGSLTACTQPAPPVLPTGPLAALTIAPSLIPTMPIPTAAVAPTAQPSTASAVPVSPTLPPIAPTATLVASPTFAPTATLSPGDAAALEARLLTQINELRAANALPPYQHHAELSDAARAHSCDMAANQFIGHESSDGRTLTERIPVVDPPWVWPSESVAAGVDDPALVIAMWMDEPPEGWHRRNLLDTEQTAVGVGYCFRDDDPSGNRHYWTMDITRH
jgi:uncharacterized protein YkwD